MDSLPAYIGWPPGPRQMNYMDLCYFATTLLPPTDNEVAVLPTIQEENSLIMMESAPQDANGSMHFHNIGVQTLGGVDEQDPDARYEDAGVQTIIYDYEDYKGKGSDGLNKVGVQTDAYVQW